MRSTNYTQVSNDFIEQMYKFDGAEIKVFLAITRKTIGWHKTSDRISYSQLESMTGLSITTIKKAIKGLVADNWIVQINTEKGYMYDLNIEERVSVIDTHKKEGYQLLAGGVSVIDTEGCQLLIPTLLKENKETKRKKEELSVSKINNTKEEDMFINDIIEHVNESIKKLRRDWEVFAMSINLIDKSYPEDLDVQNCLHDPLFDFAKIKANIANSKRLRGIGKGNSKANTVSLKSIVTNPNLRQQIMDGEFDDSKSETAVKFVDSKQYDWEVFRAEMLTNETYKEKYAGANIKHYYDELKSWSKRNQKKSYDWIEEALNFMRLDSEGRGLKLGNGETKTFTIREGYGQS